MNNKIQNYINNLKIKLDSLNVDNIAEISNIIKETNNLKGKLIIFGNGGSATTASHFFCDFSKTLKYKAVCLNDTSILTAYSNDFNFDNVFSEQIKTIYDKNDLIIGISTSGNSKNIINAFKCANELKIKTLSFTGYDGGELKKISNYNINIDINDTQISEDIHLILMHILYKIIK